MVRDIQSNRLKVIIGKKTQNNLDALDEEAPIQTSPIPTDISASLNQTQPHKDQSQLINKISAIDNVLAVVECAAKMECNYNDGKVTQRDIIERMNLMHIEQDLSATHSSCCSFGRPVSLEEESTGHASNDIEAAAARSIKEQTGHSLLVLCDQPSQLSAVNNAGKMKWVQIATILDSGAVRHVTPNGVFSLTIDDSQRAREGHNYYGPAGEPI